MPESTPPARRGSRGPAPSRTAEEIAAAAIALADRDGLQAATVRAVAASLGTAPAALYRYVDSRSDLVARMTDAVLAGLAVPEPTGDVVADLAALTEAQIAVLRRHPWLIDVLPAAPLGPAAIRGLEAGLRVLEPVPAGGAAKLETLAVLTGVATLFARSTVEPDPRTVDALTAAAATHPRLAAAFAEPGRASPPDELLRRTVAAVARGLLPLD